MAGATTLAIGPALASDVPASRMTQASHASGAQSLAAFYASRDDKLVWFTAGVLNARGRLLIDTLARADEDGLNPANYLPADLTDKKTGDPSRLDRALSQGFVAYLLDLRQPSAVARFTYTDPSLPPPHTDALGVLALVARDDTPAKILTEARRINPIYDGLRSALMRHRRGQDASPAGRRLEKLILVNMDRARGLPARLGERYVWVDIPAARLMAFDHDAQSLAMPVVVGKRDQPTPMMVGLIRYAVVNPYWNIPEDLVRTSIAPKVLRQGTSYLEAEGIEVLSGWSDGAAPLAASQIAWSQVASGETTVRARQRPGPSNMMGVVKLMSPNNLGIYLHDTPFRGLFSESTRTFSSGCVRLQDARRLSRWLLGEDLRTSAPPETRLDLPAPTPLYLTYFTALPTPDGGVTLRDDIYGLDERP